MNVTDFKIKDIVFINHLKSSHFMEFKNVPFEIECIDNRCYLEDNERKVAKIYLYNDSIKVWLWVYMDYLLNVTVK